MIGLVGVGNMGTAIAERLAGRAELVAFDLDPERAAALTSHRGIRAASTLGELAATVDALLLSLPSASASAGVVAELAPGLRPGAVVIETSTVAPADMRALAPLCAEHDLFLVDAAILSGVAQMRSGETMLLVGGDAEAARAAEPILALLADRRLRLGPLGSGMAAKVANNAVSHAVMVVLLEATAIAQAEGVEPERFAELLSAPDAGLLRPLAHRLRERIFARNFEGGMPMEAARKDSVLALRLAQDAGVPVFAILGAHAPYDLAMAAGLGREDYAALAKLWEQWTGKLLSPAAE